MGSWLAKLAGHKEDAAQSLKNPQAVASYTLFFGFIAFVLLMWITSAILTIVRIYKKYTKPQEEEEKYTQVRVSGISTYSVMWEKFKKENYSLLYG